MKKQFIFCIVTLLIASTLLTACGSAGGEGGTTEAASQSTPATEAPTTPPSTEQPTEAPTTGGSDDPVTPPEDTRIEYRVTVLDYLGKPMNDIVIGLLKNGEQQSMKVVKDGVATFKAEKGDYTLSVSAPSGDYYYDPAKCVLSEATPETTVQLYLKTSESAVEELVAISHVDFTPKSYVAHQVTEGGTYVNLTAGDMEYFVFRPTREGVYKVSFISKARVEIGYYGSPMTVAISASSRIEIVNHSFELEVRSINLGETPDTTTPYVIGLKPGNANTKNCILTIEWVKNPDFDPVDASWMTVRPTETELQRIKTYLENHPVSSTFRNLDVTNENLKVVYNEADGFYHYNTADGPVVYVRIGTASTYLDDFITVCGTGHLGCHFYDADGKFLRKETYNELMTDYVGVSTPDEKACPLNQQLAEVLHNIGENKGWWKPGTALYLFGTDIVSPEVAWLFACGYYE